MLEYSVLWALWFGLMVNFSALWLTIFRPSGFGLTYQPVFLSRLTISKYCKIWTLVKPMRMARKQLFKKQISQNQYTQYLKEEAIDFFIVHMSTRVAKWGQQIQESDIWKLLYRTRLLYVVYFDLFFQCFWCKKLKKAEKWIK